MNSQSKPLERRRSWFFKDGNIPRSKDSGKNKAKEKNIEIVSSSIKREDEIVAEESVTLETEKTLWKQDKYVPEVLGEYEVENITKDSEEEKMVKEKSLQRKSSLMDHLFRLNKNVENNETDEDSSGQTSTRVYSSSAHSVKSETVQPEDPSVRPRSQSFLGHSVTPLRIRDSISYLFGLEENISQKDTSGDGDVDSLQENGRKSNLVSRPYSRESPLVDRFVATHPGIPCNRSALLDHHQKLAFAFELDLMRKATKNFNYYYRWAVWLVGNLDGKKISTVDRLIENKYDLKVFMRMFGKIIGSGQYYKVHIFKLGLMPRRNDKSLTRGITLDFKVSTLLQTEFFRNIVGLVLSNELYRPESVQLPVCGISYRQLKKYSIISLWILPSIEDADFEDTGSHEDIVKLINFLKDLMSGEFESALESAMIIKNDTLSATKVFQDPKTNK